MRAGLLAAAVTLVALLAPVAHAAQSAPPAPVRPSEAAATLVAEAQGASAAATLGGAWFGFESDGAVAHMAAAPGRALPTPLPGATPATRAHAFLIARRDAFGLTASAGFSLERTDPGKGRSYHRFQQTLDGLPVLGAETIVQLDAGANVEAVHGKLARASLLAGFDGGPGAGIDSGAAGAAALADLERRLPGAAAHVRATELVIFVPSLFEIEGPVRRVWAVTLAGAGPESNERVLVDARDGTIVWRMALHYEALRRLVEDANSGTNNRQFTVVRTEGQGPASLPEANTIYDDLGATWTYYWNQFGRDSYDAAGDTLRGVARYCGFPLNFSSCTNASFTATDTMYVGAGFAADDVIGHEITHGVTQRTSNLAYSGQSGAMNESMSDVFGEFIDLTDGVGDDSAGKRWLLGEDMAGGALRNMKDPTISPSGAQPDRLNSPNYVPPSGPPTANNDYNGVHTNSGVGNKLCFLLTDGQSFNGQSVYGMGIPAVGALYYETNAHVLTSTSGWVDLFYALRQAAVNLGWSVADQNNLYRACVAVEIAAGNNVWADAGTVCVQTGAPSCFGVTGPARTLGVAAGLARPGDTIWMVSGTYHEALPLTLDKIVKITPYGGAVTIGP